ncbi:MAG TPA: sulfite exporter TauE/SafE family protein [Opitutaceae bacterium]|nr:sulfite exporter TauE/SafE family protein [Opitutaceae bacterium]
MDLAAVNSPATALIAGLVTSLHCVGMCGPLVCSLSPLRSPAGADTMTTGTAYHLSRLGAYALLGAIAGGIGAAPLTWVSHSALRYLPWALVLLFLALALRWDRFIPQTALPGRALLSIRGWVRGRPPAIAASLLGFVTPLLPCGPLYFLLALALLSGSVPDGLGFMLAFGLGTVPLLWLVQSQFNRFGHRLSPVWIERTRITLALVTAAAIAWRLRATLGLPGPDPAGLVCH